MIVVTNTSPLIALDRIGKIELLPDLFGKIIRPSSVREEIDDLAARLVAEELRLNVMGSLGILLAAHTTVCCELTPNPT